MRSAEERIQAKSSLFPRSGALRKFPLRGAFIQYWPTFESWGRERWKHILQSMHEIGMDTVVIFHHWQENGDHSFMPEHGADSTEVILTQAEEYQMRVFLGLKSFKLNGDPRTSDITFLKPAAVETNRVASAVWERYIRRPDGAPTSRHTSFAGWYIPVETWTVNYTKPQREIWRWFFRTVSDHCKSLSPAKPIAISPFISKERNPPNMVATAYTELLQGAGIDLLMLQDGVGALGQAVKPSEVAAYYDSLARACTNSQVEFWGNIECFRGEASGPEPTDIDRLDLQVRTARPITDDLLAFDFLHYLNPHPMPDVWWAERITRSKRLYHDYQTLCAACGNG
jgi:hypothetical protein